MTSLVCLDQPGCMCIACDAMGYESNGSVYFDTVKFR
jgi:hypothetical protein